MPVQRFVHISYYFLKMELREVGSGIAYYYSEFKKEPPTCRSMSMRYEYLVMFTTVQNILFSTLEPRPGRAQTSAKMHHVTASLLLLPVPFVYRKQLQG